MLPLVLSTVPLFPEDSDAHLLLFVSQGAMNSGLFAVLATALLRRRLMKIAKITMTIVPTQAATAAPIIDVDDDAEPVELALLTNVPLLTAGASVK